MKPMKIGLILSGLLIILGGFWFSACGDRCGRKSPVIARIGYFELTRNDFDAKRKTLGIEDFTGRNGDLEKNTLLHQMITEELLLQEAQRLKLDKDEAFMKIIEDFWRQSLLTLLVSHNQDEMFRRIHVSDADIERFYDHMKYIYQCRILKFSSADESHAFLTSAATEVKMPQPENALLDTGFMGHKFEDIEPEFRDMLLQAAESGGHRYTSMNGDHYVILYTGKQPRNMGTLADMKQEIEAILKKEQYRLENERYMLELRKNRPVIIYEENLKDIT